MAAKIVEMKYWEHAFKNVKNKKSHDSIFEVPRKPTDNRTSDFRNLRHSRLLIVESGP